MNAHRKLAIFAVAAAVTGCVSQRERAGPAANGTPSPAAPPPTPQIVPDAVPRYEPRSRYGNPPFYEVYGKRYYVLSSSSAYVERGVASWYGPGFHQERTSTGEPYDMYGMTAAHKTLPLPAYVRVTNLQNGRTVVVRVNDRGPFVGNRIIDLSYSAALRLDMLHDGTAMVEVRSIDPPTPTGQPPVLTAGPGGSLLMAAVPTAMAAPVPAPLATSAATHSATTPNSAAAPNSATAPNSAATPNSATAPNSAATPNSATLSNSPAAPNSAATPNSATLSNSPAAPNSAATLNSATLSKSPAAPNSAAAPNSPAVWVSAPTPLPAATAPSPAALAAAAELPPEPPAGAPPAPLFVQAGAFADPANAERLAAKLRGGGFGNVFVRNDLIAGRKMYRVRLGPVPNVPEFDRIVDALERAGVRDAHLALD